MNKKQWYAIAIVFLLTALFFGSLAKINLNREFEVMRWQLEDNKELLSLLKNNETPSLDQKLDYLNNDNLSNFYSLRFVIYNSFTYLSFAVFILAIINAWLEPREKKIR